LWSYASIDSGGSASVQGKLDMIFHVYNDTYIRMSVRDTT
jgi:hypothetical protein